MPEEDQVLLMFKELIHLVLVELIKYALGFLRELFYHFLPL